MQYLQLPRPKRDIEAAFSRALDDMPSQIQIMNGNTGEIAAWLFIMRKAAKGDAASIARLDALDAQISKPAQPAPRSIDVSAAKRLSRLTAEQALETVRAARKTLPVTSPTRLNDAVSYLAAAASAGEDPFEMRQIAEDATRDEQSVWVESPTDALTFEFMVASLMARVDGADQYDLRTAKALSDAQSKYATGHPCLVKFMLERAAALHAVHKAQEADQLLDQALAHFSSSERCVDTGTADSLAIYQGLVDVGLNLEEQITDTQRFDRVVATGRGLESDVLLAQQGVAPLVKMHFDGFLPLSQAARQGDRDGAIRALDVILEGARDPQVLSAVRTACPAITNFLQLLGSRCGTGESRRAPMSGCAGMKSHRHLGRRDVGFTMQGREQDKAGGISKNTGSGRAGFGIADPDRFGGAGCLDFL